MRFARHADEEAGIGLAPLIDVVLLLLIFFLVTTSFREPQLPLSLPRAATGEAGGPERVVVSLGEDGALRVDGRPMDLQGLDAYLAESLEAGPPALELRADEEVLHGRVVEVLDLARRRGVETLGIAVRAGEVGEAGAGPPESSPDPLSPRGSAPAPSPSS